MTTWKTDLRQNFSQILTSDPGPEKHFEPLHQKVKLEVRLSRKKERIHFYQVDSTIMYTGHGYIPCEG